VRSPVAPRITNCPIIVVKGIDEIARGVVVLKQGTAAGSRGQRLADAALFLM
jgi:hypothetical protein